MKRFCFFAVSALFSLAALAQPKLKWLETVHDFGAFHEDLAVVDCSFRAVNVGTEPVVVLNARANCGCTKPTYPKTPVAPGDTLVISVAYDAIGRPGKFSKQVKVETNASSAILLLKGTVIGSPATLATRYPIEAGEARLSNAMTPFGQTTKGRVLAAAVNIYNPTDHEMRPAVDSLPPYVNALFRPEVIKSGEQGTLSLTAYTDRCPDYGIVTDSFVLIPDSNNPAGRKTIATTVIVNEDFSKMSLTEKEKAPVAQLSTQMLEFGHLTVGSGKVTQEFTVTNTGKQQLIVRRLFTADMAVDLKINKEKIAPGKSATVKVTVDRSKLRPGEPLNARVTLICNSPAAPTQIIRVVGEVNE